MNYLDRTELFKEHADRWVAMTDDDRIICSGRDPDAVLAKAKSKGFTEPFLTKIPNPKYDYLLA